MKILIVDDKIDNLYLLEAMLKGFGYETLQAVNGAEALEKARREPVDLIISDVLMPVMDGFTFCRECKLDPELKDIPFIFYSATYTDPRDEEFALNLGADKYILKPQEPDVFIEIIMDLLTRVSHRETKTEISRESTETVVLREYNAALIRKLEDKMRQTEENEKKLKKYILELEANIELRKISEAALKRSEQQYRTLTETAPVGIFRTDISGNTTYVNPCWCEISGMTHDQALQNGWLNAVHPDDRQRVAENWQKAVQAESLSCSEYRFLVNGERIVWVSGQAVPQRDESGKLIGYIGIINNITERKYAEQEIRILNAELETRVQERTAQLQEANNELEAFNYSVSHDLRNPLQIIEGYCDLLSESLNSSVNRQPLQDVDKIRTAVKKMAGLIDDMLNFSRVNRVVIRKLPVNLSNLAHDILPDLIRRDPSRSIDWRIEPDLHAECDMKLMHIVLCNLLGNAYKFTRNKAEPVIMFGKTIAGAETVYFIRDNGAGFDMKHAGKLFTPFERLHSEKEFEGTGIGLATVRRIIQRHGGRLWAEGEPNQGATVYFTL